MSIVSIRAALETAVNSITPALPTAWENAFFTPPVNAPWQQVFIMPADPDNVEFGGGYQQVGIMQISLRYPRLTGSAAAATRAELIKSTLKRGNSYTSGEVITTIQKTASIGNGMDDGEFWFLPVKIQFYANINL